MNEDHIITSVRSEFGKESCYTISNLPPIQDKVIPVDSLAMQYLFGMSGIPLGRIIEILGWESTGKSTLTLYLLGQALKVGIAVLMDSENSYSPDWAIKQGVDISRLIFVEPETLDDALKRLIYITRMVGEIKAPAIIAYDSVTASPTMEELLGVDNTDQEKASKAIGLRARKMGQALRILTEEVKKANCTIIFVNQVRVDPFQLFGDNSTTTGGNALKFHAAMRFKLSRANYIKDDNKEVIGIESKVVSIKNKVGIPYRQVTMSFLNESGLVDYESWIQLGEYFKIIKKNGGWYDYNGVKFQKGNDNLKEILSKTDLEHELLSKINNVR